MKTDVDIAISKRELIKEMGDNQKVIIVKSTYDTFRDVGWGIKEYGYTRESDKDEKRFIDCRLLFLQKGLDGSVFITMPKNVDAKRIVAALEKEYPDEFSYEIADKAELKKDRAKRMEAMLSGMLLKDEPPQPS
ncbi:MAG: hypothetical protein KAJ29_04040 [Alphaproteobacteria bacterium]|nr:hypothetical protein [Alphaproteobacteria bacterium]